MTPGFRYLRCALARNILPPSEIDWRHFWAVLHAQKGTIYFTEFAQRVEHGNCDRCCARGLPLEGGEEVPKLRGLPLAAPRLTMLLLSLLFLFILFVSCYVVYSFVLALRLTMYF